MATDKKKENAMTRLYRSRIGEPATTDESTGYWIFAVGLLLGVVGILLFLPSTSAGDLRQVAIVLAAAGLAMLLAGPLIRLPLRRTATLLVYAGLAICALGIVYFVSVYPAGWNPASGQSTVIGVYALGLLVMGVGGIAVPILSTGADQKTQLTAQEAQLAELREALADADADEEDMARLIDQLRGENTASETGRANAEQDRLDAEADEADLAAQLTALRTSQARFELYQDKGDEWRWRLRHRNGNTIADSGESYTRQHNAQKGMQSVRRNALGAELRLIERAEELPAEEEEFVPPAERESRATFETYEDKGGEQRWRLRHDNGNIIADSAEGYSSGNALRTAISRVQEYVPEADYLRFDPTGFEVYRDASGEFRWRLIHKNGNILADGSEGYSRRHDAKRAVDRLREQAGEVEFEVYEDRGGEYRWRALGRNDEIVADSGEGYSNKSGATDAVERVRNHAPDADVLDAGRAAFEIYEDKGGEHRWRLRHRNGNIIADCGEGYSDRSGVYEAIESVKRNAPNADAEAA